MEGTPLDNFLLRELENILNKSASPHARDVLDYFTVAVQEADEYEEKYYDLLSENKHLKSEINDLQAELEWEENEKYKFGQENSSLKKSLENVRRIMENA